jgi:hypothetical protein
MKIKNHIDYLFNPDSKFKRDPDFKFKYKWKKGKFSTLKNDLVSHIRSSFNISQYFEKTGENGFHLMPEYNPFLKSLPYHPQLLSKAIQKQLGCQNIFDKIKMDSKRGNFIQLTSNSVTGSIIYKKKK